MFTKDLLFQNDRGALHHAYLITGDIPDNISELRSALEKIIGVDISSYPDYYLNFIPAFSVDDSRELIERQTTRSFAGGKRFFVIASYSFTPEAQNGLLKVLEDPIVDNHFFVLSTTEELFLPTLRSRLFHIRGEKLNYDDIGDWCNKFIKASVSDRMLMVEKLLKEEDKEGEEKLVKQKVKDILSQIEKVFADRIKVPGTFIDEAKFLSELIRMKGYLNDTAPAIRLILDYIALICPF